jgi:hypothetical protein
LTDKKNIRSVGSTSNDVTKSLRDLASLGKKKGYLVSRNVDYGCGMIDLVWYIEFHPGLSPLSCGFIGLNYEQGNTDEHGNHSLLSIVEEAVIRGIRSGLDRVYIVCLDEKVAKSVDRESSRFKSLGSLLQFNPYLSGLVACADSNA